MMPWISRRDLARLEHDAKFGAKLDEFCAQLVDAIEQSRAASYHLQDLVRTLGEEVRCIRLQVTRLEDFVHQSTAEERYQRDLERPRIIIEGASGMA